MQSDNVQFHPQVCPRCEYSLRGHPAVGVCPECGLPYDDRVIYLYGEELAATAPASHGVWHFIIVMLVFLLIYFTQGIGCMILIGLPLLVFAFNTWRWFAFRGLPAVQVKLSADGFRQGHRQLGIIPFAKNASEPMIPWSCAGDVSIDALIDLGDPHMVRLHLRITSIPAWWDTERTYVHARIRCTLEQVAALRGMIDRWRAGSGHHAEADKR